MRRSLIFTAIVAVAILLAGCHQTQSNSNTAPSANTNASPLPEGITTSPLPPGATPTPGIPDVKSQQNTSLPAGTPTPGIPDLRTQKNGNANLDEKTTPSKGPAGVQQSQKRRP